MVDGSTPGTYAGSATSATPNVTLSSGDHTWSVIAKDSRGQSTSSATRTVNVQ